MINWSFWSLMILIFEFSIWNAHFPELCMRWWAELVRFVDGGTDPVNQKSWSNTRPVQFGSHSLRCFKITYLQTKSWTFHKAYCFHILSLFCSFVHYQISSAHKCCVSNTKPDLSQQWQAQEFGLWFMDFGLPMDWGWLIVTKLTTQNHKDLDSGLSLKYFLTMHCKIWDIPGYLLNIIFDFPPPNILFCLYLIIHQFIF